MIESIGHSFIPFLQLIKNDIAIMVPILEVLLQLQPKSNCCFQWVDTLIEVLSVVAQILVNGSLNIMSIANISKYCN